MKLCLLLGLLVCTNAYAGEGFTWASIIEKRYHIPQHIQTFVLSGIILLLIGVAYRIRMLYVKNIAVPDKKITLRNFVEIYGHFIYKECKNMFGEKHAHKFFPFVSFVFIFIFICNFLGLMPGFLPPTEHLSTTFALGLFSFIYYNYVGIKDRGIVKYLKHFAGPLWYLAILIFPIEIISNFIRPFSLGLRLRGNMIGDHIVLSTFSNLVPALVPIVFLMLGVLICLIQAYVFTMLSMIYISLAISHHEEGTH